MCIFEYPRRIIVWVIILSELLCYTVLLADKGCLVGCLLGTFRNLHSLLDVLSDVIWTEIEDRQMIKTQYRCREYKDNRKVESNPLISF